MRRRMVLAGGVLAGAGAAGLAGWRLWPQRRLSVPALRTAQAAPIAFPQGPVPVYHLGHSLVGAGMPALLAAAAGHAFDRQTGWGTSLRDHWRGEVRGLEATRPAPEALDSGDYAVVVLTEMVELRDAIRWHDSARYLAKWAARARAANPAVRVLLYETWHRLDDPAGWLARIEADRRALWEDALLRPAMAGGGVIHLVPGGPVLAAAARAAEAGQLSGIADRRAFFSDEIHLSPLGEWLIAQVHHAVIYGKSPEGLPVPSGPDLPDPDLPGPDLALALQRLVWQVVSEDPATGARVG